MYKIAVLAVEQAGQLLQLLGADSLGQECDDRCGLSLGATEAMMLAHCFTNAMLDALVRDGLAKAERRAVRAVRRIEVTWLTIAEDGRQALAG
jgi:hypothetical protein